MYATGFVFRLPVDGEHTLERPDGRGVDEYDTEFLVELADDRRSTVLAELDALTETPIERRSRHRRLVAVDEEFVTTPDGTEGDDSDVTGHPARTRAEGRSDSHRTRHARLVDSRPTLPTERGDSAAPTTHGSTASVHSTRDVCVINGQNSSVGFRAVVWGFFGEHVGNSMTFCTRRLSVSIW